MVEPRFFGLTFRFLPYLTQLRSQPIPGSFTFLEPIQYFYFLFKPNIAERRFFGLTFHSLPYQTQLRSQPIAGSFTFLGTQSILLFLVQLSSIKLSQSLRLKWRKLSKGTATG
ncbi:hypothetical protein Fmac_025379 [Flemingia macrophylla]|uniref:Uncharacterized protein n=1 Tax=Flemingia macrophylla TaxID=520843 RepID=A0ABD1LS17_9FABA